MRRDQALSPKYAATHSDFYRGILLYGHYRIAYLIEDDGDIVVLGVFHGALDISRYQF